MVSPETKRPIYRSQALEHYRKSQDKDVLPYINAPQTSLIMWTLLVFLMATLGVLWWNKVPVYTFSSGILQKESSPASPGQKKIVAVVFLSAHDSRALRPGWPTQLQIGAGVQNLALTGQIERVAPNIASPQDLRKRYNLNGVEALIVTQPSIAVTVRVISSAQAVSMYAGSIVKAQIQTGEQSLLSLLLGIAGQ